MDGSYWIWVVGLLVIYGLFIHSSTEKTGKENAVHAGRSGGWRQY